MPVWKCVKEKGFGITQCNGEPEWEKPPIITGVAGSENPFTGTCKLEPETCGKFSKLELSKEEVERLSKTKVIHTLISAKKDTKENTKTKGKDVKKETSQGSLF